jgi:protein Cut8
MSGYSYHDSGANRYIPVSAQNPRKRKASPSPDRDDEMTTSPAISNARLPPTLAPSSRKRPKSEIREGPFPVERLLETLDKDQLSSVLTSLIERNPELTRDVVRISPRPSVQSTLQVLRQYYNRLINAFPLDPNPKSDYCYDRVRPQWRALLDALTDFTPPFLPPHEPQTSVSFEYLDNVTQVIHDMPEWDTPQYNRAKHDAYEEISRAWTAAIKEASKRGGGMNLQYNGWEEKLRIHNEKSGGLLKDAYNELMNALGWLRLSNSGSSQQQNSIRQQLFSNSYGMDQVTMRTGGNW